MTTSIVERSKLHIHVTDRRTYKECRRRYKYGLIERLAPLDAGHVGHLWMGSAGHLGLATYYQNYPTSDKEMAIGHALRGWQEYNDSSQLEPDAEITNLCHELLIRYMDRYWASDQWEIIHVEVPIKVAYEEFNAEIVGQLDLIVKIKGEYWVVDHKFLSRLPNPRVLEMDDQMTAYIWAARKAGYPVKGAIYNVIRKKLPAVPDMLQSGKLSTRANMDTDLATYLKTLERFGLDPEDYSEFITQLESKEDTYFHRSYIVRNQHEVDLFELNLMAEFREMTREDLVYYPNPGERCGDCKFQALCKCENEGGDPSLMKQTLYRVKESHER